MKNNKNWKDRMKEMLIACFIGQIVYNSAKISNDLNSVKSEEEGKKMNNTLKYLIYTLITVIIGSIIAYNLGWRGI